MRNIMRIAVALFSGNMAYAAPGAPVRGYDSPARDIPVLMPLLFASATGPDNVPGTYQRIAPFIYNNNAPQVVSDIYGRSTVGNSNGLAGGLVNPGFIADQFSGG